MQKFSKSPKLNPTAHQKDIHHNQASMLFLTIAAQN
jgi:hypothetical protein